MSTFDGLHVWLGIPPVEQPPHYYRLLGIPLFEANLDVIDNATESRMLKLKNVQSGPHQALSQQLLNWVTTAQICLLDANKKAAYDAQLAEMMSPVAAVPVAVEAIQADVEWPVIVTDTGRTSFRMRRNRKKTSVHPALELVKIVLGGAAGLAVAVLVVFYFTGRDLLGNRPNRNDAKVVAQADPVPEKHKREPINKAHKSANSIRSSDIVPDTGLLHGPKSPEKRIGRTTQQQTPDIDDVKLKSNSATKSSAPPAKDSPDQQPAPTPESPQFKLDPKEFGDPPEDPRERAPPAAVEPLPANLDAAKRKRIDNAIADFQASHEKWKQDVLAFFDKLEATARRQGDVSKVDTIKDSRLQFKNRGQLPIELQTTAQLRHRRSTYAVEIAYRSVRHDLLREHKDELVAALESELKAELRRVWPEPLGASSLSKVE